MIPINHTLNMTFRNDVSEDENLITEEFQV